MYCFRALRASATQSVLYVSQKHVAARTHACTPVLCQKAEPRSLK